MLHVNPKLRHKGMLVVFNPMTTTVKKSIRINLYYTGLTDTAKIREKESAAETYSIDRRFDVTVPVEIPAQGMTWFVIE